jgi:CelD/BcsL family acetyltransferase involved in cellulose biosynthesis
MLRVETCTTLSALHALRAEWADLLRRADNNSVFSSWEWVDAFWKLGAPARRPLVLLARDDAGKLAGVLPLTQISRFRVVPTLEVVGAARAGYPVGDYGGLVAEHSKTSVVWLAMMEALKKHNWWVVDLRNCPAGTEAWLDSDLHGSHYTLLPAHSHWQLHVRQSDVCRRVPLPATWEEYLASLSSNTRQNMKRKLRKLREDGYRIEQVDSTDDEARESALRTLFDLHQARWEGDSSGGAFLGEVREMHLQLARNLAPLGHLDLRVVRSPEGEIGGVIYNFRWGGTTYFYQMGLRQDEPWTKYSLGFCLLADSLAAALDAGCRTFDLLRGDHEYKAHFGGYTVNNLRVTIYRFGWLPQLEGGLRNLKRGLRAPSSLKPAHGDG